MLRKNVLTAKWPLTSALDICDTRFVMVDDGNEYLKNCYLGL